jgi:hypothetical protein
MTAHVQIKAPTIAQKHVAAATTAHDGTEQVTSYFIGAQPTLAFERTSNSVLGLETENAPSHERQVPP